MTGQELTLMLSLFKLLIWKPQAWLGQTIWLNGDEPMAVQQGCRWGWGFRVIGGHWPIHRIISRLPDCSQTSRPLSLSLTKLCSLLSIVACRDKKQTFNPSKFLIKQATYRGNERKQACTEKDDSQKLSDLQFHLSRLNVLVYSEAKLIKYQSWLFQSQVPLLQ